MSSGRNETSKRALGKALAHLIEPSPRLADTAVRRKSKLLATALLAFTFVFLCVDVALATANPDYAPPLYGYAMLAATYVLNRSGRYRLAAALVIAMFPVVVFAQVYGGTAADPHLTLGYLALAPMLGTILLPVPGVVLVSVIDLAGLLLVPVVAPEVIGRVRDLVGPLSVNAIASAVAILAMDHYRRVEADRRAELADREARLRLALDGADMGTWTLDVLTGDAEVSSRAREIFGLDPAVTRTYFSEYQSRVHPEDLPHMNGLLSAIRKGERSDFFMEYRVVRPNEPIRRVEAHGSVLARSARGEPLKVMGVLKDVTARRHAQEEREGLEAQLRQAQKMEALGRFAGGVAHDFNNLLTVIVGNADLVGASSPAPELEEIRQAAASARSLTRQLLAFGRKAVLSPRVLSLNETVEQSLKMLRRIIGEDIAIDWVGDDDLWLTRVDESQLQQVILNLATNARDAMPLGGRLLIRTTNVSLGDGGPIGVIHAHPGEFVRLSVSDTGVGMDEVTKGRVFEPFFTTKEVGKGTGLGLAMVFGIVSQSGGFVSVDSTPGAGSTFHAYFPRALPESTKAVARPTPPALGRETILLVEDEPAVRRLVSVLLGSAGYDVLSAGSPDEALALWEQVADRVQLVISDVVMPGMTGPRMVERLRRRRPELRVLFMTGYAPEDEHVEPSLAGTEVLLKPFTQDDLAAKVRAVLDAAAAADERMIQTG